MTRMHTGFTGVVQHSWPRPRAWARPERLEGGIDTLPGVGAALAKRLRALGIETVRDLLLHRPRRYESAVDEIAISQLGGAVLCHIHINEPTRPISIWCFGLCME
jgi:hypothetical protein